MTDGLVTPPTDEGKVPSVSYAALEEATSKWAKRVGQGGFGEVFSGTLNGRQVGGINLGGQRFPAESLL